MRTAAASAALLLLLLLVAAGFGLNSLASPEFPILEMFENPRALLSVIFTISDREVIRYTSLCLYSLRMCTSFDPLLSVW